MNAWVLLKFNTDDLSLSKNTNIQYRFGYLQSTESETQ